MWIANLLEKTLMLGKTEDKRRRGRQRMRWLDSITDAMDMNLSKFRKILKDRGTWCAAVHGTWLSKWTTTKCSKCWPRLWGLSNEQSPCPHGAYILVQFKHPVMSSSLQTHGLQHTSPPCPSLTPGAAQTRVHRVGDAIQPSHPLSSLSPPAFSLSQHQGLFQWVSSSHQVAKELEFQL